MSEKKSNNNNSSSDLEESARNEEYLLGFDSQYKPDLYKEEEDAKEIPIQNNINLEINKKLSVDSTSISISQENNLSEINLKRQSDLSRDDPFPFNSNRIGFDFNERNRKMSSPLCDYLDGSNKFLFKTNKATFDIKSSSNFIKKENFFGKRKSMQNLNNFNFINNDNNNIINNNMNINFMCPNQNIQNSQNNKKIMKDNKIMDKNQKCPSLNNNIFINNNNNNITNINNYNNNYINNNLLLMNNNNNYPQQIFNINYINLNNFPNNPCINNNIINKRKLSYNLEGGYYFNNILFPNTNQNQPNLNPMFFSYNEDHENCQNKGNNTNNKNNKINNKKIVNNGKSNKKPFDKRKGDWRCPSCNNLNFAFRVICNRCKLQKPNNTEDKEE